LADSTLKRSDVMTREQLPHKQLTRRSETEAFSGSVIQSMHRKRDVFFRDGLEVHLLWKELSDQPVHILVGAAFP